MDYITLTKCIKTNNYFNFVFPYILGGAVIVATIGAYMYFDKQEEKTISVTIG